MMVWHFRDTKRKPKKNSILVSNGDPETFLGEVEGDIHLALRAMALELKPGDIIYVPDGWMWYGKPHGDPRN